MFHAAKRGLLTFIFALLLPLPAVAGGAHPEGESDSAGVFLFESTFLRLVHSREVLPVTSAAASTSSSAPGVAPLEPMKGSEETGEASDEGVDSANLAQAAGFSAHLFFVADVPPEYGLYIWRYSLEQGIDPYDFASYVVSENSWSHMDFSIQGTLKRADNVVFDYEPTAYGGGGELGISQIMPFWVRKGKRKCVSEGWAEGNCDELIEGSEKFLAARKQYNKVVEEFGKKSPEAKAERKELEKHMTGGMFDPRINFRVAAYVIRKAHERHAEELTPKQIKACKRARRKARKAKQRPPTCATQLHHEWWAHLKLGPKNRDQQCGQAGYKKRKFRKVRASLTAVTRPDKIWKQNRKEYQTYCGGN